MPAFGELDVPAFSSFLLFAIASQELIYAFFKYSKTPASHFFSVLRLSYGLTFVATVLFGLWYFVFLMIYTGIVNRSSRVEDPETI